MPLRCIKPKGINIYSFDRPQSYFEQLLMMKQI
jgi:hypothetical protein